MSEPTVETSIWLALKARVTSLALSPVLPIAWPNQSFIKPASGYLRVTHTPNTNRRILIASNGPHQRLGLLQIDAFAPKNQDAVIATQTAGLVAAHFPADLKMIYGDVTVRVTKAPDVAQSFETDTHWKVPVTVSYECFA
jgi:hypothetical protein